jgi:hypothetical protein
VISESEKLFSHRARNIYKIQYSVTLKEEGIEASNQNLDLIRRIYDYLTPYVSQSPRGSYLNYRDVDLGTNGIGNGHPPKGWQPPLSSFLFLFNKTNF